MILLVPLLQAGEQLRLEGKTVGGMVFSGKVVGVTGSTLLVDVPQGPDSTMIGLPVADLDSLSLLTGKTPPEILGPQLEGLLPLFPYWDPATRAFLLRWIRFLGDQEQWRAVWNWAGHMEDSADNPEDHMEATLLKCMALLKMDLHRELADELQSVNNFFNPIEAPPSLCWLNARSLHHGNRPANALFWAELPSLRIPAASHFMTDECALLATQIRAEHSVIYPKP